ncbi:hypothetical protein RRG08_034899 [Elysia crispata]|uniref:Uncharacterized protein n=1 Tax=Elysia crispata TaxID=231223 RepID=A0AAE1AM32_9GAST|nr:hypothetical protein RRG08_034899 [Elysia crispata]
MADSKGIFIKISLILLVIGLIIFVIGFGAPYWIKVDLDVEPTLLDRYYYRGNVHSGLWSTCEDYERWASEVRTSRRYRVDECFAFLGHTDRYVMSDELRATQFFETIGLIGLVATIVTLLLGVCVESLKGQRIVAIVAALFCLASAGSIILGTIIYGSKEVIKDSLSWAFALTVVSGIFFIVIGIIIVVGAIVNK